MTCVMSDKSLCCVFIKKTGQQCSRPPSKKLADRQHCWQHQPKSKLVLPHVMRTVYVLELVNDHQYHEGSDFWFDTSIQHLIDSTPGLEDASDMSLTLRTFNEETSVMIANSWDDDQSLDKIDV